MTPELTETVAKLRELASNVASLPGSRWLNTSDLEEMFGQEWIDYVRAVSPTAILALCGAVPQWQDISTAPKNVSVLVFIPNCEHYGPGIYRAILVDMGTGPHWQSTAVYMGRDIREENGTAPTHWMPLPPEPPK